MTKEQLEIHERCKGCKFCLKVRVQNKYWFYGCYYRPYMGKRIIEIENCPREIVDRKKNEVC